MPRFSWCRSRGTTIRNGASLSYEIHEQIVLTKKSDVWFVWLYSTVQRWKNSVKNA
jgi:hypothetical protein